MGEGVEEGRWEGVGGGTVARHDLQGLRCACGEGGEEGERGGGREGRREGGVGGREGGRGRREGGHLMQVSSLPPPYLQLFIVQEPPGCLWSIPVAWQPVSDAPLDTLVFMSVYFSTVYKTVG